MKIRIFTILLTVLIINICHSKELKSDLTQALSQFATYEYGQPKKVLHDTRLAALRGTDNENLRLKNEQLLLAFVQSDAGIFARREACFWLSDLATEASRPVLEKLSKDKDFADVAQIALDAIVGEAKSTNNSGGSRNSSLSSLTEQRQIVFLNTLMLMGDSSSADIVRKIAVRGKGNARVLAIEKLGLFSRSKDVGYLQGLYSGNDKLLSEAAYEGLLRMSESSLTAMISKCISSDDIELQASTIKFIAARGFSFAAESLWEIAFEKSNSNMEKAILALGKCAPAGEYERLVRVFVKSEGESTEKKWQKALWNMSRRMPDYNQALGILNNAKAGASEKMQKSLVALGSKLEKLDTSKMKLNVYNKKKPKPVSKKKAAWVKPDPKSFGPPVIKANKGAAKKILVVTGNEFHGHKWRETAPAIVNFLSEDKRMEVSYTEDYTILASKEIFAYDSLFLNYQNHREAAPGGALENLRKYLHDGGGMVLFHFACGAFISHPKKVFNSEFMKLVGRSWNPKLRGHDPFGIFTVNIADRGHQISRGMEDYEQDDELYTCLDGDVPIHVLASAVSKVDKKAYPMALTYKSGKGRVFLCTLGHDLRGLNDPTKELYRRGTAWTADLTEK